MKPAEPFSEQTEESMEEILASIRKIMDAPSLVAQDKNLSPNAIPSSESLLLARETSPKGEDVLVLTKKSNPSAQLSSKESKPLMPVRELFSGSSTPREGKNPFESLVTSSLSPLIQSWLEKNLATIVEKVVKEELRKLLDSHSKVTR